MGNIKSTFERYSKNEISQDDFKRILEEEHNIIPTSSFNQLLNKNKYSGLDFSSVVKSLDVLKEKEQSNAKNYMVKKDVTYARYKKVENTKPNREYNDPVMTAADRYCNGELQKDEFLAELDKNGVCRNSEEINKMVRLKESGDNIKIFEMMNAVKKAKQFIYNQSHWFDESVI